MVALYEAHAASLHRYGTSLVHSDPPLVQEAVQEVFLRYFAARLKETRISDSQGWLFRELRGYLRKNPEGLRGPLTVGLERLGEIADRRPDPERTFRFEQFWSRATAVLSPRELECLLLRAEGLSYQAIAKTMGIRIGTVGVVLARGLKKLHKLL